MSPSGGRLLFDGVWKKFHRGRMHDSLRDLIPAAVGRLLGRRGADDALGEGDFWALRDLSFEVAPGECLGIIGSNGAGKSTALKLLTRIYEPTLGRRIIEGRVGTLIEVSAGFHGDLTGRENVYLQGAIMGMRTREIARKFDQIVEFSGVGEFLDTPVKRYSSGMNARLGFAIAAHLEPDVLVIDEVLAVGDLAFQTRAFDRIREMTQSGIPVVIVSHQLDRLAELCSRVIVLRRGEKVAEGSPSDAIADYVMQQGGAGSSPGGPMSFEVVRREDQGPVGSGRRFTVGIRGVIHARSGAQSEPLQFRVRSLRTGQLVYVSGAQALGAPLPTSGPFAMELSLQANLPPGGYLFEVALQELLTQKDLATAPPLLFRVSETEAFRGIVQLNPLLIPIRDQDPRSVDSPVSDG